MAKIGPWSVKGVDNEARQLARKAAQASGLTIGSWIDRAILRATADPRTIVSPQDASPTPDRQDAESAKPEADAPEAPSGGVDLSEQDDAASIRERLEILAGPEEGPEERPDEEQPQADSFDEDKIDSAAADGARTPMAVPPHVEDAYRFPLFRYLIGGTIAVILLGAGIWAFVWLAQPGESYRTATKSGEQPKEAPAKSIPSDGTGAEGTGAEGTGDRQQAKAKAGPAGSAGKQSANESAARLDRLKKRAQRGEAMAQFDLGLLHIAGLDVSRDDKEAARWREKSALQGFEKAQYNLGVLYDKGLGVKKDPTLAFFWYQSAAEQGYALAQHNLGVAYANGRGVRKSYENAHKWFEKAAAQKLAAARYSLGRMYEIGLGVEADAKQAKKWYGLAAKDDHADAKARLKKIKARGLRIGVRTAAAPGGEVSGSAGKALIRETQRLLTRLGFSPGRADGVPGGRTDAAIRLYQKYAGFPVDGKPSPALLRDLRAVAGAGKTPSQ